MANALTPLETFAPVVGTTRRHLQTRRYHFAIDEADTPFSFSAAQLGFHALAHVSNATENGSETVFIGCVTSDGLVAHFYAVADMTAPADASSGDLYFSATGYPVTD